MWPRPPARGSDVGPEGLICWLAGKLVNFLPLSTNHSLRPPQVETLKLGWCKIGGGEGAKAVADLVMFNTSLKVLDLRGNGFGNDGEECSVHG